MEQNIYSFMPFHKDMVSVHAINLVYETKPQTYDQLRAESVYKMYYVCSGQGCIHTPGKTTPLSEGDIFFTFPAVPFAIESMKDFSYMYISFMGLRGNMIMESLNISNDNFIFHHADEVYNFWKKGLSINSKIINLMSESILLYTFSFLGDRILQKNNEPKQNHSVNLIKKYLDENFTNNNFSIEDIASNLCYNKKYISHVFKKHFGIGIIEYLNTIRVQNACTMIEQGFTSVNDIADSCGYSDAAYFSKIFKTKMGIAPTQYIKAIQTEKAAKGAAKNLITSKSHKSREKSKN